MMSGSTTSALPCADRMGDEQHLDISNDHAARNALRRLQLEHPQRRARPRGATQRSGSSAAASASPASNRLAGILLEASIDRRRTAPAGRSGRSDATVGGACVRCMAITAVRAVGASNGSCPVTAKNATTPSEYRSLRPSSGSPAACSGLMNCGVPTTSPTRVSVRRRRDGGRARDAEVGDERAPGGALDEDVVGLDVAVHDAAAVRVRQAPTPLPAAAGSASAALSGPARRTRCAERFALDEPHDEAQQLGVLLHREHRDDVRMREAGGHARLAQKALAQLGADGELRRQHLDRDRPLQPLVLRRGTRRPCRPGRARARSGNCRRGPSRGVLARHQMYVTGWPSARPRGRILHLSRANAHHTAERRIQSRRSSFNRL